MSALRRKIGEGWPKTCFIESQHAKTEQQLEQHHAHILWWFVRRPMTTTYGERREGLGSKRTIGSKVFTVSQYRMKHTAIGRGAKDAELWRVDYSATNSAKGWRILDIRFRGDFDRFEGDLCLVKLFRDKKNHRKIA